MCVPFSWLVNTGRRLPLFLPSEMDLFGEGSSLLPFGEQPQYPFEMDASAAEHSSPSNAAPASTPSVRPFSRGWYPESASSSSPTSPSPSFLPHQEREQQQQQQQPEQHAAAGGGEDPAKVGDPALEKNRRELLALYKEYRECCERE